ncbi:MAG: hypothetical protein C4293_09480 [Nitrospiraceae bacterium]
MRAVGWSLGTIVILFLIPSCSIFSPAPQESNIEHGREIWFKRTYGGQRFFAFLANHPDPVVRVEIGFRNVINTPRDQRFQTWGTINDPDCRANPMGGPDICRDPNATGVIGIRKFLLPGNSTIYGLACASCHAGFDPIHPPADVNEPAWENIHPTIGNQYLKAGKIFMANLPMTDPRRIMLEAWPNGTVDTTLLFNDHIMNPSVITAFWNLPDRPTFDVGLKEAQMLRSGQGGEDDLGGNIAALRVYTNIGVCFSECIARRPNPSAPIDLSQCRRDCREFPPEKDIKDLMLFLRSIEAPKYPDREPHDKLYERGRDVFKKTCASCHTPEGRPGRVLSNDEINPLIADPVNATNHCRALTTNWEDGHLWAAFSSQIYKQRAAAHQKGYRTMPLTGIWATAPFLHNQSIGPSAPPTASPEERTEAYEAAMRELLSTFRTPKMNVLSSSFGPFPAGTPLTYVFSRDPTTGAILCTDGVENHGHYYGADLPEKDKDALIHWLKYQ